MSFYTFLRLRNAADIDKVNDNIQRVIEKYTPAQYDDWKMNFSVIPLVKYHLISSDVQKRLIIYGFLGFAIFFVAIMNYMLISIATLSRRAKGVGVHKCSGASSRNIFGMFLAETGILVIFSVLFSLLLIVNAHEIIEDLLSVRLSSLFTWGDTMGAFAYDCDTFPFGRWHTGTAVFAYTSHAGVPSLL